MDPEKLLDELVSNAGYIDGRRRFPRTFTPNDALVITRMLHGNVDRAVEARAGVARGKSLTIACTEGCNFCCEQPVTVYLPEAIRIAEWLKLEENCEAREAFLAAYPAWLERAGEGYARIHAATGDAKLAAHLEQWRRRVLCAFNRDGLCTVYAVRPILCRSCHAVGTNERCRGDSGTEQLPEGVRFAPLERYVEETVRADKAMHHALGGERNRKQALCTAVYELLIGNRFAARPPAGATR